MDPIDTNFSAWSYFFPEEKGKKLNEEEVKMQCLKLCAVRETFEESGILLIEESEEGNRGRGEKVWEGVSEKERLEWRDKVRFSFFFWSSFLFRCRIDCFDLIAKETQAR